MEIIVLGTSSMVPTADRNHSATFIQFRDEKILIDCGEGTQRQLRKARISATKITRILISHWHGDHILGLPGLLQTMGANEYTKTLQVYGPKGTKKNFEQMFEFFVHKHKKIDVKVTEIEVGVVYENQFFEIQAMPLEHSAPTVGYVFKEKDKRRVDMDKVRKCGLKQGPKIKMIQEGKTVQINGKTIKANDVTYIEKGRIVSFVTDTKVCDNAIKLAKNSDLLFCEATFQEDCVDKAEEYMHLTAKQAATIAKQANAKRLVLVHFSQRYKSTDKHVEEAKEVFNNTRAAEDFEKFIL